MPHVDQLNKSLDIIMNDLETSANIAEFERITNLLADADFTYTFPYPLKMLLAQYAKIVQQIMKSQSD